MYNISVMVSGAGSTLDSLAYHCYDETDGIMNGMVSITSVLADRDCGALKIAEKWGIPKFVLKKSDFDVCPRTPETFKYAWSESLFEMAGDVDLFVQAGFLSLLHVTPEREGKILNIHPSLLPKYGGKGYYGRHVHEAVKASGDNVSGCTVHVVDNEYDHGTIIAQETVDVNSLETVEHLEASVKWAERMLYPRAILNFLQKQYK